MADAFSFEKKVKQYHSDTSLLQIEGKNLLVGNRIPKDYFITKGKGESDIAIHAGSYHLALKEARIEMANIMTYSSILPGIANEIKHPAKIIHGSVMESIMAVATSKQGERATAGIIFGWLYDKISGEKYGGLVCEHNGTYSQKEIEEKLHASLNELYANGYSEQFDLRDIKLTTETFVPKKKHGTALVALCFTSYVYPLFGMASS